MAAGVKLRKDGHKLSWSLSLVKFRNCYSVIIVSRFCYMFWLSKTCNLFILLWNKVSSFKAGSPYSLLHYYFMSNSWGLTHSQLFLISCLLPWYIRLSIVWRLLYSQVQRLPVNRLMPSPSFVLIAFYLVFLIRSFWFCPTSACLYLGISTFLCNAKTN